MVKSISYDQQEIIANILKLHGNNKPIDIDATYSKGNFYKGKKIKQPKLKFDIAPQLPGVKKANANNLPVSARSQNIIMFDPPFLATRMKTDKPHNNKMIKRFGSYRTEKELHRFYISALNEFYRILKPNGILIFKCQDKVSSGAQYFSHNFIMNEAEKIGFYSKDLFILLVNTRIYAYWQIVNQKNARKFHSYFIVFQKKNKKIKYI